MFYLVDIVTAYHGTHHEDLPSHPGVCFCIGRTAREAAKEYAQVRGGEWVHEVEIDLDGLVVEEVGVDVAQCRRDDSWPCDSAREVADYVARGIDAVVFDDVCHSVAHRTIRLLSARALAAVEYLGGYDP